MVNQNIKSAHNYNASLAIIFLLYSDFHTQH